MADEKKLTNGEIVAMTPFTTQSEVEKKNPIAIPWVGCDLDGTVARYDGFKGWDVIGDPIPAMVERIKLWLSLGITVKILTARASAVSRALNNLSFEQVEKVIGDWTEKYIGKRLEVVTEKDCCMLFFVDDSAVQVKENTGEAMAGDEGFKPFEERIKKAVADMTALQEQVTKTVAEVDETTLTGFTEWNKVLVDREQLSLIQYGLQVAGYTKAELPSDWHGSQWNIYATGKNICHCYSVNTRTLRGDDNVERNFLCIRVRTQLGESDTYVALDENTNWAAIGRYIGTKGLA